MPRQRWNNSGRCESDNSYADPLQQLLARNLQRKGAAAVLSKRRVSQLARPSCISPVAREARRRSELMRSAQELMDLERYERRQLMAVARNRFHVMMCAFFGAAVRNMIACELSERKALFREWQQAQRDMGALIDREFSKLTPMTPHKFKAVCRLIRSETVMRRRLQVTEAQDRDLYAHFMYLEQLKALGSDLNEYRRRIALH
ncbi:conserved hypothetical protein [Leishmania braziliensis MHOM/BR/75/M2904]|uniref:Uncharacterized protein n=2 Tax=Leishmania braziliensis TaxID=5660 RepID=A4HBH3_LEIBR|nr:conserved hypothetical protein [Leishmania braziliensis MHOM/BR/75/M2904]KAI5686680.1 hypothetical protein MNV84_03326 [Leishmania braziliensis]CAJ2471823.1 unnamed protein product [Leishmania braziliensis]CAJ2472338.1 unnamed protein product [Leishmania braziliensis]CAM38759.1 conserved hypothetical protein [Leishmania braziliensis MHOM/BR/75/M2904]